MPRLVHTADVHLHPDAPERRDALAAVLERAESADAHAVTIGGDLFEDEVAAERLRPELRSLFADRPFPVVVIPGNHDRDAFAGDAFFGPAVRPATAEPFEHVRIDDAGSEATGDVAGKATGDVAGDDPHESAARLTCVPYTRELSDDLLVALRDREPFDGPEYLLVHCSLEAPAANAETGDEEATRYAPVTRSELAALDFDAVLAGHYHGANRAELPSETGTSGTFVYPGTPASVTRAETGRRSLAIVDDAATPTVELDPLDAFHYDELDLTLRPGDADEAIETVRERVAVWADRDVEARIVVEGFVDRDEAEFAEALAAAAGDVPNENRTRSVAHLLDHPIYREFESHLDADAALDATERDDHDPQRLLDDARDRLLAAMADLAAEGELT